MTNNYHHTRLLFSWKTRCLHAMLLLIARISDALSSTHDDVKYIMLMTIQYQYNHSSSKNVGLMHMTCFQNHASSHGLELSSTLKHDCCTLVLETLPQYCDSTTSSKIVSLSNICSKDAISSTFDNCIQNSAQIPVLPSIPSESLTPILYYSWTDDNHIEIPDCVEIENETQQSDYQKDGNYNLLSQQYVYNSKERNLIIYRDNEDVLISPFHIPSSSNRDKINNDTVFTNTEISSSDNHTKTHLIANNDIAKIQMDEIINNSHYHPSIDTIITSYIRSAVSADGGMHRLFNQHISINIPHKHDMFTSKHANGEHKSNDNNYLVSGSLDIILPVTEGIFIDLDQPFSTADNNNHGFCQVFYPNSNNAHRSKSLSLSSCNVKLISVPDSIIDIEQPSFVSPQHVITFQVNFQNEMCLERGNDTTNGQVPPLAMEDSITFDIIFDIVIHIRYPKPEHQYLADDGMVDIGISHAYIHKGKMTVKEKKDDEITSPSSFMEYDIRPRISSFPNRLYIHSAVGLDSHHDFVMYFTITVSLIGTLIILHNLSKVSLWL